MSHQRGSCDLHSTDDHRYYCTIQTSLGCIQCQNLYISTSYSDERQPAAAAGGDHSELALPKAFKRILREKRRGHSPDLPWVSLMNHSDCILCIRLEPFHTHKKVCNGEEPCLPPILHETLRLRSDPAIWSLDDGLMHCVTAVAARWPWQSSTVAHPCPPPCLCGSSTAERASLEGGVHLDRRPISQASIDQRVRWLDFLV